MFSYTSTKRVIVSDVPHGSWEFVKYCTELPYAEKFPTLEEECMKTGGRRS